MLLSRTLPIVFLGVLLGVAPPAAGPANSALVLRDSFGMPGGGPPAPLPAPPTGPGTPLVGFFQQPPASAALQAPLAATREEWKVLGPKLQRVIDAGDLLDSVNNISLFSGPPGMGFLAGFANDPFNGPSENVSGFPAGGPGGMAFGQPPATSPATAPSVAIASADHQSPQMVTITQALADLRSSAADPTATTEQLKQHLAAYRAARQQAQREMEAAREDLRPWLTPDQQAILVLLGYFE